MQMQMKSWTSKVYDHYKRPTILEEDGEVTYIFVCKMYAFFGWFLFVTEYCHRSPSIKVTRTRHDDSTSNLVRHVKLCSGVSAGGSSSITAFAQGSTYTPHKFPMKLAIWVARRHRPFTIVEDEELVDIFRDLNNKVQVPSRFTVSRDVKEIFDMSRLKVAEILKVCAV
jgi:hypothetical protein